LIFTQKILK